jgi:hypothetical protein
MASDNTDEADKETRHSASRLFSLDSTVELARKESDLSPTRKLPTQRRSQDHGDPDVLGKGLNQKKMLITGVVPASAKARARASLNSGWS